MISAAKDGSRVYQGSAEVCAECPFKSRCCQSTTGQARTINTDDKESLRQDMNRKMQTPAAQAIYKQRKVIVEPVFGQIPKGHKSKTVDLGDSVCAAKKKSPVSFHWYALHTISKKLPKPFLRD